MPETKPKDIQDLWELSRKDVGAIVKKFYSAFVADAPIGQCVANKTNLKDLLNRLEDYTDQVSLAAQLGLGPTSNIIMQTTDPFAPSTWMPGPSQWTKDYANWLTRLDAYHEAVDTAKFEVGPDSCEELRPVTEALLAGWYQPGAPGIVNPQVQTIPDIVTPFMLGNQVATFQDWQWKRLDLLINDMIENAKKLIPDVILKGFEMPEWVKYVIAGGAVITVVAIMSRTEAKRGNKALWM